MPDPEETEDIEDRERDFWDHHVPSLDQCLEILARPDDPNTAAMLDALGDVEGARVLDFACGAGMTAARMAQRGASVTAVDLSPVSLRRTNEVAAALGLADLVTTSLSLETLEPGFDGAIGHFALHHVDIADIGAQIAALMRPGATAAFLETFATNPILITARKTLVGRFGIPRFGTLDEHPLTREDIRTLGTIFESVEIEVAEMQFLRLFDRQITRDRSPFVTKWAGRIDDQIGRHEKLWFLGYHQVVICHR